MTNNLDTQERKDVPFYCDRDLSRIMTQEAALMRSWPAVNLTTPKLRHVYVRGYFDFQGE